MLFYLAMLRKIYDIIKYPPSSLLQMGAPLPPSSLHPSRIPPKNGVVSGIWGISIFYKQDPHF
jgi:hypothetical protein